ncbi:hypothetical protein [Salinigranum halophilum]|uniref:hypothetical protein n=1 Tax=Salinigranum halophilum TaxID=2565931 RepID=UPI0010A8ED6D|nr:hypothetical protein [Salinigranum halophilum]
MSTELESFTAQGVGAVESLHPAEIVGLLAMTLVFGYTGSLPGVAGGLVVTLLLLVMSGPYAVALGQFAMLALPIEFGTALFWTAQLSLSVVLAGSLGLRRRTLVWFGATVSLLWGGLWIWRDAELWHLALAVVTIVSVVGFTLHRYEQVRLGLATQ